MIRFGIEGSSYRCGLLHVAISVVSVCLLATDSFAASWQAVGLLDGIGADRAWRSEQGPNARPQPNVSDGAAGIHLMCPMEAVEDRCFWDVDIPLDLSGSTEIMLSIRVSNPAVVSRCSLHFRSGSGWFGGWFKVEKPGWQTVRLPRSAFAPEGHPAGWGRLEGARFSLWKGGGGNAIASLANVRSRCDAVVVLRNSAAEASNPEEMPAIQSAVERTGSWLKERGIEVGQLDDGDMADGLSPSCELVVLPYNPSVPETTVSALTNFVNRGGSIIVAYSIPDGLLSVLGLGGKRWMAAGRTEAFAAIQFESGQDDGVPLEILQDSWNAHIPQLVGAEAMGLWRDAAGVTSTMPAVTINRNGAFIGHVLTNMDRVRKQQLLVALVAKLRPGMKEELAADMLTHAEQLLTLPDWATTRAFIESTAARSGRAEASTPLRAVEHYREASVALAEDATFGELLARVDTTRRLVQEAYFHAVPNCGPTNEFRGVWCHDAQGVPGRTWEETASALQDGGFNALFANMLWAGKAYYPSAVVPVAPDLAETGDLLAQCLSACRQHDVELHLWKVCWNLLHAPRSYVETMRRAGRLQQKADGSTHPWLCPTDPQNRDLELSAILEAAQNYDIAGVHLDYIRYPDGDGCYCDGCRKRFADDSGLTATNWPSEVVSGPRVAAFRSWRSDQISAFVAQAGRALKRAHADIKLSAAVFPSWPSCRDLLGQDWVAWVRNGLVDFVCPMNYVTDDQEAATLAAEQIAAVAKHAPVYPGLGPSTKGLSPEQVVHQVDLVRGEGAEGFVLFQLDADLLNVHVPAL
ncbi:MAG: family 10 glycosylhydrolase, partial [Verrucomicrobia bacterium]|nr:family 10 glycosylhydrolase [Verrucomicrobiota bacterium]